jgi:ectoine hydroxylase-related dioxygenase (phytanoyl-CoA dioxygenase family)
MTSDPFHVSKDQIYAFRKLGYVCLRSFFPPNLVSELRETSEAFSSRAAAILESCRRAGMSLADRASSDPSELIVVPELDSPTQVCRYEFMLGSDSRFREFAGRFVGPTIAELTGESMTPFKDKTNEKLPGGGAFPPHQDFAAYRLFGPSYHATAAFAIHPANEANGCVQFATNFTELMTGDPGLVKDEIGGRALLHYHDGGPHNGNIREDIAGQMKWDCLQVSPEDLVVFDSFVPHYSEVNRSDRPRRTIFVTYTRTLEGSYYDQYYLDKRANYFHPKFHVSTPTRHSGATGGLMNKQNSD